MRRNEGIYCEITDIKLDKRILSIPGVKPKYNHKTKSGKSREIPINDPLMEIILRRLDQKRSDKVLRSTPLLFPAHGRSEIPKPIPWNMNTITWKFGRWVRLAGLPESLTLHSLRHTFASNLVQRGVSLEIIGELLGHSDNESTAVYAHLKPNELDWVMDLLDFTQPSVLDRIQRGKEARAEAFDRRKLMQVVDGQAKEIDAMRAEIERLKKNRGTYMAP